MNEMDCWPSEPVERRSLIDPEAASFFRGLVAGVAAGIAIWTAFLVWVW